MNLQSRIITALADEIGPRPATSTAEARAAAFVAAQMRQIGLEVGVQTFAAAAAPTIGLCALAAAGALAALLGWWLPWPSVALTVLLLAMAMRELLGVPTLAALLRRRASQNVIGTRAAERRARQRVVLLCHLDSPRVASTHWRSYGRWWLLAVPAGLAALLAALVARALAPVAAPALALPALLLAGSGLFMGRRELDSSWTAGAVDAAAVATALSVTSELPPADYTELWVVALGSGAAAGAGVQALLDTYPFPAQETWFINLPWLGRGRLTAVAGEGLWRERQPDPTLRQVFNELNTNTAPLVEQPYRDERLDSARLRAQGYRAISLVGLHANGGAAGFRHASDSILALDKTQLETAQKILERALVRLIKQEPA
ncbi:MAG TPA: hypothetical protein VD886_00480 [Herpetosiphonaceae bacterium]|nr:hypothetical protein [Herpetosiphonaceae bacterium]